MLSLLGWGICPAPGALPLPVRSAVGSGWRRASTKKQKYAQHIYQQNTCLLLVCNIMVWSGELFSWTKLESAVLAACVFQFPFNFVVAFFSFPKFRVIFVLGFFGCFIHPIFHHHHHHHHSFFHSSSSSSLILRRAK